MEKQRHLKHKLTTLQAQLLDFGQKITPIKREVAEEIPEIKTPGANYVEIFLTVSKPFLCTLCIFLFPVTVYCLEGYCTLFWQATVVSIVAIFLLLNIVYSMFTNRTDITSSIGRMRSGAQKMIQNAKESSTNRSYYAQCLFVVLLFLTIIVLGLWAYQFNMVYIFNISLVMAGFILGIFTPKLLACLPTGQTKLPFYSPCKIADDSVRSSQSSKRGLNFSGMERPFLLSPHHSLDRIPEQEKSLMNAECLGVARLPITPPHAYQDVVHNLQSLFPQRFG